MAVAVPRNRKAGNSRGSLSCRNEEGLGALLRRRAKASAAGPAAKASPERGLVVNGWRLLFWTDFRARWGALAAAARKARDDDPVGFIHDPAVKFFRSVRDLVFDEIPSDPDDPKYRQGKTLGAAHTHWRRAKFHRRFRLFFRFHSSSRTIIYAWLNDENTLRKAGSASDPYVVFHRMLERGMPPSDWDALMKECDTAGVGDRE